MSERKVARPSLGVYYAATRQRTDIWQRLRTHTQELAEEPGSSATLQKEIRQDLDDLARLETYFAYPGRPVVARLQQLLERGDHGAAARLARLVVRMLVSHAFRVYVDEDEDAFGDDPSANAHPALLRDERPYFEVLVVDDIPPREVEELRERLFAFRTPSDEFVYGVVVVPSFEDALIAVLLNFHIQSVVVRYGFPIESQNRLSILAKTLSRFDASRLEETEVGLRLGDAITALRPNLDLFLVTDAPIESLAGELGGRFERAFYRQEDYRELHLSILKGIRARYDTPFFSALRDYSQRPTGVFHALPIARGKSVTKSHWIRDMESFFGPSLFLAETSATTAGLDSLLQPHGSLRRAQDAAARAFGSDRTFFVTNGTSTANKIVLQALAGPGDIVLATRDCHQSHHYAAMLTGAQPCYLNPYPVTAYSFYGGVPLAEIKRQLIALREAGQLHRAKVLLLTNCTFDGIVYNPERVMEEVLAIQPDMTFIWDEAWFAFACFTPTSRRRTAMEAARVLRERLASTKYRKRHAEWKAAFDARPDPGKWMERLLPDPAKARVRAYATQSTHKTLTSFRQGSMIHVSDDDFERVAAEPFVQAYLTHTSTSANYPILASLDLGRRQVEFEGYELVQGAIELALTLREKVTSHPLISRYFSILTPADIIPPELRASGFTDYRAARTDWRGMDRAWDEDELCLDPTRLTLFVGRAGIEGDLLKKRLIEEYDIQVNKTTRNTVLFMTHIGTTRGAVAHLIDVLARLAGDIAGAEAREGPHRAELRRREIARLTERMPPLPDFSEFHPAFRDDPSRPTREGDLRRAFFGASDPARIQYRPMDPSLVEDVAAGRRVVSATFVTPYPPGFPVLVPGQVVSSEILEYLAAVGVTEIHGYDPDLGLKLFTDEALEKR